MAGLDSSEGATPISRRATTPARTPIIVRHQGLGRVSDSEVLAILPGLGGMAGLPRDEEVDTAQFAVDVDGGCWARSDGYLWHRAAELRQLISTTPNARAMYFGAMPEVPHAIAFGAYLGDEISIESYDSHRDALPEVSRWSWPEDELTLHLDTSGLPREASNAAGPAILRLEISATVDEDHVRDLVGSNDVAHIRIRPAQEMPAIAARIRSAQDVIAVRQAVREALAAIVEFRPKADTIHLFVAAPVSACFGTGQELRLRNMPPIQTYRYRRTDGRATTLAAIRLTATGPRPEDLPLTEPEREHASVLRKDLWEAALSEVDRYADMRGQRKDPSGERWYDRLEPKEGLARLRPFPTLPPIYDMIDLGATVDPTPMNPPNFYGYERGNRLWRVNDQFLLRLVQVFDGNLDDSRTLVRLFLFHEALHVVHGITKSKVEEVGKFANGLEHVDYTADLYAVLHELHRAGQEDPGLINNFEMMRRHIASLIDLVIRSFWAFEDPSPLGKMEIRRLRRYFNWYWQYQRVLMSRSPLVLAAVLARMPVVEIAGLQHSVESRRYYGSLRRFDPQVGLELAIVLDNEELKRIPTSVTVPIEKLMEAFSEHDHEQIKQGFRQIFDEAETSKHALPRDEDIP